MFRPKALRSAIVWIALASAYVISLSFFKGVLLDRLATDALFTVQARQEKIENLFQASYYFFFDDQFVPGVRQALTQPETREIRALTRGGDPRISQLVILSNSGGVLYDSAKAPAKDGEKQTGPRDEAAAVRYDDLEVIKRLGGANPSVLIQGFQLRILMPSAQAQSQVTMLYGVDTSSVRNLILALLLAGPVLAAIAYRLFRRQQVLAWLRELGQVSRRFWSRFWRLRMKFLLTIIVINAVTGAIVFVTLSSLQTRQQTERIEKESLLFSQFSTARVISDFTNYYYFYYLDRFRPAIHNTIASNKNLVGIRIISSRTGTVLFDSEREAAGPLNAPGSGDAGGEIVKADFSPETEAQLKTRDLASRYLQRDGEKLLSIVTAYRNENQESLFWVEYVFGFQTLAESIREIRSQILIDLLPSLVLGLLIAAIFAQLLISPVRRLVSAVRKVATGDFNVAVEARRDDEIGELVTAFNAMTQELKKKKELQKYLSNSTYRQVMSAAETPEGIVLGGTRVSATVLFSDIRDFVAHCEHLEAEEITAMLNEYFSEMVEVVHKHGGEVDKFIGDALLAVFYAGDEVKTIRPVESLYGSSSSGTALQAIYCALEMRERLAQFNERRRAQHKRTLEIGVGITHGEIISGPIGAKDRMDFTVIGDVVNLANRIEKLSKTGKFTKIVFSHHVEEKIRGLLEYVEHSHEKVRGKEENVTVFELVGIRDLDTLVGQLRSPDATLRRRSIELLGQSRNSEAMPYLVGCLQDPVEAIRLSTVGAIAKLAPVNDARAIDALLGAIKLEQSEKVISSIIASLGRICDNDRVLALIPFLDSPNERIVANAIEALGQARNAHCNDLILPKLMSRNNRIKANAAMALFAAGHVEVIDSLKPMLMHSDALMRSSAAFAIGELTSIAEHRVILGRWKEGDRSVKLFLAELQECVPMLVALLKDPEQIVRRQAVVALGKIKDKSAVLPIIEMVDLERNPKELSRDIMHALRSIGSHKLVREVIERLL